jgi:imidazolonepropionase-like amidohydrolase
VLAAGLLAAAVGCGDPARPAARAPAAAPPAPAAPAAAAAPVAQRVERTVIAVGRPAGRLVTTVRADGSITAQLAVLQNGRGPQVDATLRLGADGTLIALRATGRHELGAAVDESFTRTGDRARWASSAERGEQEVPGPALYIPTADLPLIDGVLVRAALRVGGTLPLLPGGTATIEPIGELEVQGGDGAGRQLRGYAIFGLELAPRFTWIDASDGSWFGTATTWRSYLPVGWEGALPALLAAQHAYERAREQRLAAQHAVRPPAAGLAYTGARVLDVSRGRWLPDHTVVVVGDTIRAVGPRGRVAIPRGAQVVELQGRALVPGLIDMHAHLDGSDPLLSIASGVTLVRDVGNDPDKLDDWARRFDAGTAIGPHVVRFGLIEGRNPKAAASKVTAETAAEAQAAVDFFVARGYAGVKIYNSVRPELVPVIAEAAHARGLQVTGHVPMGMLAEDAVRAGFDGIEHINMLALNFLATRETDTRDLTRFTLVGDRVTQIDLTSAPVRAFVELLRSRGTVIDPTLAAFEGLFVAEPGRVPPGLESIAARLPVMTQRTFLIGGLPVTSPEQRAAYRAAYDRLLAWVKALHDAGVPVVAGTDHIGGLMLHHELALLVRAGLSPAAALQLATIGAARALRLEAKVGSIAPGKRADLAVIDGDPLADIREVGAVVSTMRAGVMYPAAALYERVGVAPYARAP